MIFSPVQIGRLKISNRIAVAPMCQYSAVDGVMTDWHTQHLMQLGYSAAGLIMVEATAVERVGRITHNCVGIYNDLCDLLLKNSRASKVCCTYKYIFWYTISSCRKKSLNAKTLGGKKKFNL